MYINLKNKSKECGLEFKIVPSIHTDSSIIKGNFLQDSKNYTLIGNEFYACLGPNTEVFCNSKTSYAILNVTAGLDINKMQTATEEESRTAISIFVDDVDQTKSITLGTYSLLKVTPETTDPTTPGNQLVKLENTDFYNNHIVEIRYNKKFVNSSLSSVLIAQDIDTRITDTSVFFCIPAPKVICLSEASNVSFTFSDKSKPSLYINGQFWIELKDSYYDYSQTYSEDISMYLDSRNNYTVYNFSLFNSYSLEVRYNTNEITDEEIKNLFHTHYYGDPYKDITKNTTIFNGSAFVCLNKVTPSCKNSQQIQLIYSDETTSYYPESLSVNGSTYLTSPENYTSKSSVIGNEIVLEKYGNYQYFIIKNLYGKDTNLIFNYKDLPDTAVSRNYKLTKDQKTSVRLCKDTFCQNSTDSFITLNPSVIGSKWQIILDQKVIADSESNLKDTDKIKFYMDSSNQISIANQDPLNNYLIEFKFLEDVVVEGKLNSFLNVSENTELTSNIKHYNELNNSIFICLSPYLNVPEVNNKHTPYFDVNTNFNFKDGQNPVIYENERNLDTYLPPYPRTSGFGTVSYCDGSDGGVSYFKNKQRDGTTLQFKFPKDVYTINELQDFIAHNNYTSNNYVITDDTITTYLSSSSNPITTKEKATNSSVIRLICNKSTSRYYVPSVSFYFSINNIGFYADISGSYSDSNKTVFIKNWSSQDEGTTPPKLKLTSKLGYDSVSNLSYIDVTINNIGNEVLRLDNIDIYSSDTFIRPEISPLNKNSSLVYNYVYFSCYLIPYVKKEPIDTVLEIDYKVSNDSDLTELRTQISLYYNDVGLLFDYEAYLQIDKDEYISGNYSQSYLPSYKMKKLIIDQTHGTLYLYFVNLSQSDGTYRSFSIKSLLTDTVGSFKISDRNKNTTLKEVNGEFEFTLEGLDEEGN